MDWKLKMERSELFEWVKETYGTAPDYPWNCLLYTSKDQDAELRTYEEKIHHLADQMIAIDLDDGVKVNYAKFQDVLAKIK